MEVIGITLIIIGTLCCVGTVSYCLYKTYIKKDDVISKDSLLNYNDIYPMDKNEIFLFE